MSYREFTLENVEAKLGLTLGVESLFKAVLPIEPRAAFLEQLHEGTSLAQGIGSEKAKSEFIIAPILMEFRRLRDRRHALFSGVEFNVDQAAGLNGFCDFLITRGPRQYIVTAPVIALAEGKNDNVNHGLGQCIAEMRAAWLFNEQKGDPVSQVFGASTTGTHWKFLRLRDKEVTLDQEDYFVSDVGKILAILIHMAETA
jgi:hypothetical protein